MVLSISLSVYRYDLKTIKKQYKNSSKLVDIEERQVSKKRNYVGNDQRFELCFLYTTGILYEKNLFHKVLRYRCNEERGAEFWGINPKKPLIEFMLIVVL
jgi:hypothetical protein